MNTEKMPKVETIIVFSLVILIGLSGGIFAATYKDQKYPVEDNCSSGEHFSYFSDKTFFDKAYSYIPGNITEGDIRGREIKGIIVNHHLLAASLIAEEMEAIATDKPVTVILMSPNHFFAGKGKIISSEYNWNTPYGTIESDCNVIKKLWKAGVVSVEEKPFEKEHGISGIVPFIKKSLPNAKVVPVIFKDNASEEEIIKFVDTLYEIVGEDVLVVGSFDFSHYVLPSVAKVQDQKSINIIKKFDYAHIGDASVNGNIAIDSKPGLSAELRFIEKINAKNFNLVVNMNSADITKLKNSTETTSYVNGFFYK